MTAGGAAPAIEQTLSRLGAHVQELEGEPPPEAEVLVYDGRLVFETGGAAGLGAALEQAWSAVHAVATQSLIPASRGRVMLLAPPQAAGPHAAAAREGLVNLARTLSIEWARYGITATALLPGAGTSDQALGELVAFLASPAGAYFSGCRFDLGLVPA